MNGKFFSAFCKKRWHKKNKHQFEKVGESILNLVFFKLCNKGSKTLFKDPDTNLVDLK